MIHEARAVSLLGHSFGRRKCTLPRALKLKSIRSQSSISAAAYLFMHTIIHLSYTPCGIEIAIQSLPATLEVYTSKPVSEVSVTRVSNHGPSRVNSIPRVPQAQLLDPKLSLGKGSYADADTISIAPLGLNSRC